MNEEKRKKGKHPVADIPVLGPAVWAMAVFIISEVIIGGMIGFVYIVITGNADPVVATYALAIGGVIALFLYQIWFKREFKGAFNFNGNFTDKKTAIGYAGGVILAAVIIIISYITAGVQAPTLLGLGTALMAGICEEVSFRLAPISVVMRKPATNGSIAVALVVSTILFCLVHASNVLIGQSAAGTVIQVVGTMGLGLFLGTVYLRTGNLLLTILFHTIYDFFALMQGAANGMIVDNGSSSAMDIAEGMGVQVLFAILGIYIIFGKTKEIEEVWKERWGR